MNSNARILTEVRVCQNVRQDAPSLQISPVSGKGHARLKGQQTYPDAMFDEGVVQQQMFTTNSPRCRDLGKAFVEYEGAIAQVGYWVVVVVGRCCDA